MMSPSKAFAYAARLLAPRRGATFRTLIEAGTGCGVLIALAVLLQDYGGGVGGSIGNVPHFLGLFWLIVWPAWRLRPVRASRWWARIGLGLLLALGVGVLIAAASLVFSIAVHPENPAWNGSVIVVVWFLILRGISAVGAVVARRARFRYRWQLIVSHVGIIVLMFVILTSAGSVLGLVVVTHYIASHPVDMATSVRDDLQLAHAVSPLDLGRTDEVFRLIDQHRLLLRG